MICQREKSPFPENSKTGQVVETSYLEETSKATDAVLERQELRKEEADVDAVRSLEGRHKDGCLKVRRSRQQRKRNQDGVRFRQRFAATRRREISRTVPRPKYEWH
jgi:hypothetical protein